jgi:hypothetical protein
VKAAVLILALFVLLWFGYGYVADYEDSVASGSYVSRTGGVTSTMILRIDHSFHQERTTGEEKEQADGTWRRIGEGGLVFSKGFLELPGQRVMSDGTAYATLYKTLGLWPFISMDSTTTSPIFRKKLLP